MMELKFKLNETIGQYNEKVQQGIDEMLEMLSEDDEGFERLYIAHEKTLKEEKALLAKIKRIRKQIKDSQ